MYIAVRLRGHAGVNSDIEETMLLLGLKTPNTCVIIPENAVNKGMLAKVKDYVAWGEADEKVVAELKVKGKEAKTVIRFSPPSKGFRSLKLHYPRGDLGYHGKAINEFLQTFRQSFAKRQNVHRKFQFPMKFDQTTFLEKSSTKKE